MEFFGPRFDRAGAREGFKLRRDIPRAQGHCIARARDSMCA